MKRLRLILFVTIAILVIVGVAGRKYLSGHLAGQIASRMEAAYGGPVTISAVDIGWRSSSLKGVQLFENGRSAATAPWVTIEEVEADISVLDLLGGPVCPGNITLTGAAVTLRFDKEGHLLTGFPAPPTCEIGTETALPNLRLEHSRLTLHKEGAADLMVADIKATLQGKGEQILLAGHVDNLHQSNWGPWTLQGVMDRRSQETSITLKSDGAVPVTQAMLNELPFVQEGVWREVQVEGAAPISTTIRYDGARQAVHYRILLEPRETEVHVPAIDLEATGAKGTVIVEDGVVQLRDVLGQAFDGTIGVGADLDFRQVPARLEFSRVEVQGLAMHRLPQSWDLPRQIEGRLRGSAKLEVLVGNGSRKTRGQGQGLIDEARIGGQPTAEPIRLELQATDGGFGFSSGNAEEDQQEESEQEVLANRLAPDLVLVNDLGPQVMPFAARVVNDFFAGLDQAIQSFMSEGSRAMLWLSDQMLPSQRQPDKAGRFVQVSLKMDKADLARLVKGLGLKLPFAVGGNLSFQVQASIPLDTSGDLKTYRVRGSAHATHLRLANIELDELEGTMDYSEGVLRLQEVQARITGSGPGGSRDPVRQATGTLQGTARLQLVPLGELTADLKLNQIPLSRLAGLAGAAGRVDGSFSGTVVAHVPAAQLKAVNSWEATAKITDSPLHVFGWTVQDGQGEVRLKQGLLSAVSLRAKLEGAEIVGSGELQLANPYPYRGQIALHDWDLTSIQHLDPKFRPATPIEGQFSTSLEAQGSILPPTLSSTGKGKAHDVTVYGMKFKDLSYAWQSDGDQVRVEQVQAGMYDGTVSGGAVIPLRPNVAGSLDLHTKELDVGALAGALAVIPFKMEGRAGGTLKGTLAPALPGKDRVVAWDLDLQAARLRLQSIPTEKLKATIGYHDGTVDYCLEGQMLGGRLNLDGRAPPDIAPHPLSPGTDGEPKLRNEGRLRLQRAKLSGVSEIFHLRSELLPLHGLIDVDIKYHHEGPERSPVGSGQVMVTRPRWGDFELAPNLQGDVLVTRQQIRLRDITASVGEGVLHSQLAFNLHRLEQSWFTLNLEGVEASRVLASWPSLAGKVEGPLEAHMRGRLGREWSGGGELFLSRGKILGAEIADWRLPLTWSFAPDEGRGQITCRETSARLASGRATGQADLSWGTGVRLDGQLRFVNLELRHLLPQLAGSSQVGNGRVTGRFDFAAAEAHSLEDLTGNLEATLTQNQAFQFPVLREVAPFLGVQTSSAFESGELRARLAQGAFRIQNLLLQRPSLQVSIEGNAALAGSLALDVIATTDLNSVNPARLAGLRLPAPAAIPIVRLRVTGTAAHPNVRLEPPRLLAR
jgi:hypothetical protein